MNSILKNAALYGALIGLSACVTTREELNQQRGIAAEDSTPPARTPKSVQEEDITRKETAPQTKTVTQTATQVPPPKAEVQPETPSHPVTAPAPGMAEPAVVGTQQATSTNTSTSAVASTPAPTPTPRPDLTTYGPDELRAEVAKLSGEVEELEHEKKLKDDTHAEELKKAQERIAELEKRLKTVEPETPTVPEGKSPFEAGKDAFASGKYDEAITFMTQALQKSEKGKEAEEATYLRGESYFKKQNYNKAIVDFSHFPEKYQKSSFHPKALLRIAEAFEAMGRKDDAKAFYSDVVDKFPKTAEGKLAKKRLKAKK